MIDQKATNGFARLVFAFFQNVLELCRHLSSKLACEATGNSSSSMQPVDLQCGKLVRCPEPNSDRKFSQIKAVCIRARRRRDSRIVAYFGGVRRDGAGRLAAPVGDRWDRAGIVEWVP